MPRGRGTFARTGRTCATAQSLAHRRRAARDCPRPQPTAPDTKRARSQTPRDTRAPTHEALVFIAFAMTDVACLACRVLRARLRCYRDGLLVPLGSLGGVAQPRSLGHGSPGCPMTRELGHDDTACAYASLLLSMGSLSAL